jgi:hypothetical protein
MKTKTLIHVTEPLLDKARALSLELGISVSEVVRRALYMTSLQQLNSVTPPWQNRGQLEGKGIRRWKRRG